MFSFGHSGGTSTSIDAEQARDPPPPPTLVYFPQNDVELKPRDDWVDNPPDLFKLYSSKIKPAEVRQADIEALNFSLLNDVDLEDLIPGGRESKSHLPPTAWTKGLDPLSRRGSVASFKPHNAHDQQLLLSNGKKAPTQEEFTKFAVELGCHTEDGLRVVGRRKARKGRSAPYINHCRDFWVKLELVSQYWDTSLDDYYETDHSGPPSPTSPKLSLRRLSLAMTDKSTHHSHHGAEPTKKYKGLRKSTGSKMPDSYRADMVTAFVRNAIYPFHCEIANPRKTPQVEFGKLLIPVTQSGVVWRVPEDKNLVKRGVREGPVLPIQSRHETQFVKDHNVAVLDLARECACLLLTAQERAREGRPKRVPGAGEWFTTKSRWGGGPGGEFGEAEGNTDVHPSKRLATVPGSLPKRMTEEEIWKELKPNQGQWDVLKRYTAIGKERNQEIDSVFMISSLFHHLAIVRLDVDPSYLEYIVHGRRPPTTATNANWYKPQMYRSRWFDLLEPQDRLEAFRGLWGMMSYLMRIEALPRPSSSRQKSEVHNLLPLHAKKDLGNNLLPQRSHSVAF